MSSATDRKSRPKKSACHFTAAERQVLRQRLLAWYARHARDLPWRQSRDPYPIWVSEIMLQQTQVATVCRYFPRFIRALPNVYKLADADEPQVLRLWEGLGYYRRARQMHVAAKQIVSELGGEFPKTADELMQLPGIGRYTAGAVASIAFGQRTPILEANTIRLFSRLIGYRGDPLRAAGQRQLWQTAAEILPRTDVARFNQALMELGSLVCVPVNPFCDQCPLTPVCVACAAGEQHDIPREKLRPTYTSVRETAVVIRHNGQMLLRKCGDGERWAGLWDFPRFARSAVGRPRANKEVTKKVRELTGVTCVPGPVLGTIKHGVTRFRITLDCLRAEYKSGKACPPAGWFRLSELGALPLSTTGRKIAGMCSAE